MNNDQLEQALSDKELLEVIRLIGEVPGTWTDEEPRVQIASEL